MYINKSSKSSFISRCCVALLFLICISPGLAAQSVLKMVSWNIQNLGKSKTPQSIQFIAEILKPFDVVALQEVVAGAGGSQAVASIVDALNRKGFAWDYAISDPTSSNTRGGSERYAFLWKKARVKVLSNPRLEPTLAQSIEREPFLMELQSGALKLAIFNFHALPKSKHPETEIKLLKTYPDIYKKYALVFCGDFNTPESNNVFNPLKKMGYRPAFSGQKTTLRQKCLSDGCLASAYDNFFFRTDQLHAAKAGVIPFYRSFPDVKSARKISDHLPVFLELKN